MGTEYSIACIDCKVTRDLSKFYAVERVDVNTREDAIEFSAHIEKSSFQAGLLVSFMTKHRGHLCVFFNEYSTCSDELEPCLKHSTYKEDTNFWREPHDD